MRILLLALLLTGCAPEGVKHLDKAIVQDEAGRLYRIEHTIETDEATGNRTVCGKLAHDEYMKRLRAEQKDKNANH